MPRLPHSPGPWRALLCRVAFAAVIAALFAIGAAAGLRARVQQSWSSAAPDARGYFLALADQYPEVFDPAARGAAGLQAFREYSAAFAALWKLERPRGLLGKEQIQASLAEASRLFDASARELTAAADRAPGLVTLTGSEPVAVSRRVPLPYGSAVLLVRRQQSSDTPPRFFWQRIDLAAGATHRVDISEAHDFFVALEFVNAARASSRAQVRLASGPVDLANLDLTFDIPPQSPVQVEIREASGDATAAAVGLYNAGNRIIVPKGALDFSGGGYAYFPSFIRGTGSKYWPGGPEARRRFFVRGSFNLDLPAGAYRLITGKGPEYIPVDQTISVTGNAPARATVELRRWIDMARRGWYSGDCHVHFARPDQEANRKLMLWMEAEDLRMGNILRMGDARWTYFEQYGYGKPGRFVNDFGAVVPGQEDPRSGLLGHTISLNLQAAIRDANRYYVYGATFDEAHRQGGVTGYAHVLTEDYDVERDMTINVARNKADFAEICEFASVGTALYYQFLDLGFRLTAAAGSDVPWGRTIGDSRVYVYTGGRFGPDSWFDALRRGRTFVTAGPMFEFTVNGRMPGEQLHPKKGTALRIVARALVGSQAVPLGKLEIVANGEVVRSAEPRGNTAELQFDIPADRSMWIAARAASAHTTPVYVTVEGKRHWNAAAAPRLIEKRLKVLDDIERQVDAAESIKFPREPEYENAAAFRDGAAELRAAVREARTVYLKLRAQAAAQQNNGRELVR